MAQLHSFPGTPLHTRALERAPTSFLLRIGRREIFVCRDYRKRFYWTHPFIDCSAGVERGHLELLLFRRWLVIFSRAR